MRTLSVALGARSYPIHIGAGLLARAGPILARLGARRAVIVTDSNVAPHHLDPATRALGEAGVVATSIVIPAGEEHKTWATLYEIHTRLLDDHADRSTLLVALGGGVVGDVAGFAASTYQRGIPLVQVPTTLLAQVDSSVGGKTAVNHPLGKNMIGTFYQPVLVLADVATLDTLPDREYRSGIAEVIKYGAIRDPELFAWLERAISALGSRDAEALAHAIHESCRIKAEIVALDEHESGVRALLNFGHTFGHAIEAATGYGTWLHGEAVAAGMSLAGSLSERITSFAPGDRERLVDLIARAGLPVRAPALAEERWMSLMAHDKKTIDGELRFILLEAVGRAVVRSGVRAADLRAVLPS